MADQTVTEITASEIEALRTNASEALADVMASPASRASMARAIHLEAARKIIVNIPAAIRNHTTQKQATFRNFVSIMPLENDNFKPGDRPLDRAPRTAANLTGVAAIVFKACVDANLEPYVGSWYELVGGDHYGICLPLPKAGKQTPSP